MTKLFHVKPGESIQAAIDLASNGDTIFLHPGFYNEKGLTIEKPVHLVGRMNPREEDKAVTPSTKQPAIDIDAVLVGPELDKLIAAEVMGWKYRGFLDVWKSKDGKETVLLPEWSTFRDLAAEVEAEIERRGLQWSYEACLLHQVWKPDGLHVKRPKGNFLLITASPEQRCRAALRAVMG